MSKANKIEMLKPFECVFAVGWTSSEDGEAPPKTVQVGEITRTNAPDLIFALAQGITTLFRGLAPQLDVEPDMFIEWLNYALKEAPEDDDEPEGVTS